MEFFRVWFDHVAGFCLFVARRRVDLETHQPVDTKVQIEVRNFKRLSGRSAVRKNADERAPPGFAPAFSACLCASRKTARAAPASIRPALRLSLPEWAAPHATATSRRAFSNTCGRRPSAISRSARAACCASARIEGSRR